MIIENNKQPRFPAWFYEEQNRFPCEEQWRTERMPWDDIYPDYGCKMAYSKIIGYVKMEEK